MEENGFFQIKFNYAGYFKTVKTACGLRYCDGQKYSLMVDLDGYNLFEFCRDVRSLWEWGVTENIGVWYIARNVKPKKYIQVFSEQELMGIFTMYNDVKEAEIFITIQSQGIPLNYNGEVEGVGIDEGGAWEGVGEEPAYGIGEEPAEGLGEDVGEKPVYDIGEKPAYGEVDGIGEEPAYDSGDWVGEEPAGEVAGEDVGQVGECSIPKLRY